MQSTFAHACTSSNVELGPLGCMISQSDNESCFCSYVIPLLYYMTISIVVCLSWCFHVPSTLPCNRTCLCFAHTIPHHFHILVGIHHLFAPWEWGNPSILKVSIIHLIFFGTWLLMCVCVCGGGIITPSKGDFHQI